MTPLHPDVPERASDTRVQLGVIEFHSPSMNAGLIERFYHVVNDLRDASCIVDLWLMDIASVLAEHGYEMTVHRTPEKQAQWDAFQLSRRSTGHTRGEDK